MFWSVSLSQISIGFKEGKKKSTPTESIKTTDKYHHICTSATVAHSLSFVKHWFQICKSFV